MYRFALHTFALCGVLLGGFALVGCFKAEPQLAQELPAPAEEVPAPKDKPKVIAEDWFAAYYEGVKGGHVHTLVEEIEQDGAKIIRTTRNFYLVTRRYNASVTARLEIVSDEKPNGKVVSLGFTHFLDEDRRATPAPGDRRATPAPGDRRATPAPEERRDEPAPGEGRAEPVPAERRAPAARKLVTFGQVEDGKLVVKTNASPRELRIPWNDEAIGYYAQDLIYKKRKVKPGDSLHFLVYELSLLAPLTMRATVKEEETVDVLLARKVDGEIKISRQPARLLRVETQADKIEVSGRPIELPGQVVWLDRNLLPVRYESDFPGLGKFTLYETTREGALKEGVAPALLPDLGLNTIVSTKTIIDNPYDTTDAVYHISVKGDKDPASTFSRDSRQGVKNVKGTSFDLHVKAGKGGGEKPAKKEEYLESSSFLDSDSPRVQGVAARIIRGEKDPWAKACKIEKWVHDNMKPSNSIGFATASQVCRDLEGDCRQHAMLTAALCRAVEVPARTAVGLIYVKEPDRAPVFIFHMWTEVLLADGWHGLDATLGKGGISACHLKVADHSWRDTQTLAPLLPVARLLGKLSIEVISAK